jgi:hypothetical protein
VRAKRMLQERSMKNRQYCEAGATHSLLKQKDRRGSLSEIRSWRLAFFPFLRRTSKPTKMGYP